PRVRHVFTLPARPSFAPIQRSAADPLFEVFARWEVAREHRLLDKLLWIESPELAHLRIGLDDGVGELSVDRRHLANVDVEYRRAVFIEPHRPDRAMSETDAVHRLEEGSRIVGLAARGFQRLLDNEKRRVRTCRVEAGIVFVRFVD